MPPNTPYLRALEFLTQRVNYERTPQQAPADVVFKLDRMRRLLRALDDPHDALKVVHVAGTKGKGSTAAMVASCLTAAGYRTGRYTSPHLIRVEERYAIDDVLIGEEEFVALVERLRPAVDALQRAKLDGFAPTYFELTTALAFLYFAQQAVDVAVLEVGLGGRLDSTNVCRPEVSLITSISYDHTAQLGTTLAQIAREKAGIIKPGVPVCSATADPEAADVIAEVAAHRGSPLRRLGADFHCDFRAPDSTESAAGRLARGAFDFRAATFGEGRTMRDLRVQLPGRHQCENAAVAIAGLVSLAELGWRVDDAAIRRGLAAVTCPGRIEVLRERPLVVLDTAHNGASMRALVETLGAGCAGGRRTVVLAATRDKDLRAMLAAWVGRCDRLILTRYEKNPRSAAPEDLACIAAELGFADVEIAATPSNAWRAARAGLAESDLLCVTGSFFIAGEIRELLAESPPIADSVSAASNESVKLTLSMD